MPAHLAALAAAARPAGSAAEAAARAYCARVLANAGFDVCEEPFEYSAAVGRWATPAVGGVAAVTIAAAAWLGSAARPTLSLAVLIGVAAAVGLAGRWAARFGVLSIPVARRQGVNLVAMRQASPRVWLVAHLDSKSQPVPIAVRAAGILGTALVWLAAVVLAAVQVAGATSGDSVRALWGVVGAVGVGVSVPVMASVVGTTSAGALDNASGVATVLVAAESLDRAVPVGVLITSAEELGLAGARAWVRAWDLAGRAPGVAINSDGVDDAGPLTAMYTGKRPNALLAAAASANSTARARRLVPGILVDAVAFADAGWETLTVSKGTLATLGRIHTRHDTLDAMSGQGIDDAAALIRALAEAAAGRALA